MRTPLHNGHPSGRPFQNLKGVTLMALREGLPSNMLYADGASIIRNFIVIVAWHGGLPK